MKDKHFVDTIASPMTLLKHLALLPLALAATVSSAQQLPPAQSAAETTTFLRDLVRTDTQNPPGNESKVALYIAEILKHEGIPYELLEPVPGRASIVARLKGTGAKQPILLLAHEDVVPKA
jgi:acetylornithine deacetylase/succinyl-diaminopimelate desuccinylase-like protein